MKCPSYNTFFETIAPPIRIKIIESLRKKDMCVSEICDSIEEEQSKVSHNLRKLVDCHFLSVKRKGKQRIYGLNRQTIVPLLELVEKHVNQYCCQSCTKMRD
jgi:DNA-binding transcriptional ArsR family regulator